MGFWGHCYCCSFHGRQRENALGTDGPMVACDGGNKKYLYLMMLKRQSKRRIRASNDANL